MTATRRHERIGDPSAWPGLRPGMEQLLLPCFAPLGGAVAERVEAVAAVVPIRALQPERVMPPAPSTARDEVKRDAAPKPQAKPPTGPIRLAVLAIADVSYPEDRFRCNRMGTAIVTALGCGNMYRVANAAKGSSSAFGKRAGVQQTSCIGCTVGPQIEKQIQKGVAT